MQNIGFKKNYSVNEWDDQESRLGEYLEGFREYFERRDRYNKRWTESEVAKCDLVKKWKLC